jgi:GAF domain-containing protein
MTSGTAGVPPSQPLGPTDLVQAFSALQLLMVTAQDVDGFLTEVARLAAGVVDPRGSCGITVRRGSEPLTVASSDERAERIDEAQYGAGAGPCLDSLSSGTVVDAPDLAAETRWPEFRRRALEQGVYCSLSVPLTGGASTLGALNLYGRRPRAFDAASRQQAGLFAAQAATALVLVLRSVQQAEQSIHLERALSSRTEIDQAIGILMAEQRCTADQAFALLRQHSQNTNRKLRDVAADLITRVTGQAPVTGPRFDR